MISLIKERLKVYQAKEIQCPKSTWAGVIIPIFEKDGKPFIVLTKRTHTVKIHKGEVSFPGGMYEDKDGDRINTAIRECCEEIGVKKNDMEILGRLDDMFTLTGVCVRPYVGSTNTTSPVFKVDIVSPTVCTVNLENFLSISLCNASLVLSSTINLLSSSCFGISK
ncbi:MAG: CoA pyrophosphatase [Bacteroidia bacterium]|nr:CoA pyrophosphatase [Bacteroidia bacterium]